MTSRQVRRAEARRATKEGAKGYPQAKGSSAPAVGRRQTVRPAISTRTFGESIFAKVLAAEHADDTRLGMPALSEAHSLRRRDVMSSMTGGRGFTVAAKTPAKDAQGMTRGDRKRAARARAFGLLKAA